MSTKTVDIAIPKPTAFDLSLAQNLLRPHNGLDALPGYVVVVFEKLERGGARFSKIVNSDERFRRFFLPFFNSPDKFFGVAVNQSDLSYSFEAEGELDNDPRKFTLIFRLSFRAADPRVVAELNGQDPLKRLTDKIAQVIKRSCASRNWRMIKENFRQLEQIVLFDERPKLNKYAATLGLDIVSLELDRRLPPDAVVLDETKIKVETSIKKSEILATEEVELARTATSVQEQRNQFQDRATQARQDELRKRDRKVQMEDLEQKFDVEGRTLDRQLQEQDKINALHHQQQMRDLAEKRNEAIGTAFMNVGRGINTPDGLRDGFNVAQDMSRALNGEIALGLGGGSPAAAPLGLPAKEDTLSALLVQGLGEVAGWHYPDAQQRALRSAILHIIAEALLSDDADDAVLQQYVDKLNQLGRNLHPALSETQFRLLNKFRNVDALKNQLG